MQTGELSTYLDMVDKGLKPIGMCMKIPPTASTRSVIAGQRGYGTFDPSTVPDIDYTKLAANWERAGVWCKETSGRYRLTRLGEYFQPKVLSMLMGYTMANSVGVGEALKLMGGKMLAKLKG